MLDAMALSLAENLKAQGILVLKMDNSDEQCDAALWITNSVHLQVGYDYVQIVEEMSDGMFKFTPTNGSVKDIINKLKGVVK